MIVGVESSKFIPCSPSRMVLAAAGGVDHEKLVQLAKEFFCTDVAPIEERDNFFGHQPCAFTGSEVVL